MQVGGAAWGAVLAGASSWQSSGGGGGAVGADTLLAGAGSFWQGGGVRPRQRRKSFGAPQPHGSGSLFLKEEPGKEEARAPCPSSSREWGQTWQEEGLGEPERAEELSSSFWRKARHTSLGFGRLRSLGKKRRKGPYQQVKRLSSPKTRHRQVVTRLNQSSGVGGFDAWREGKERREREEREQAEKQAEFVRTIKSLLKQAAAKQQSDRLSSLGKTETRLKLEGIIGADSAFKKMQQLRQLRKISSPAPDTQATETDDARQLRSLARRHKIPLSEVERIKRRFDELDQDCSGDLDHTEFLGFLKAGGEEFGFGNGAALSERVRILFEQTDGDGSGRVTLDDMLKQYDGPLGHLL